MISFRHFFAALLLLLAALPAIGQDDFITETPPMLYRGKLAKRYNNNFNGTPYWDTLSFRPGAVMYNGHLYEDVLIKIDAAEQKLVVKASSDMAAMSPDGRQIEWFTRGSSLFVNLVYEGVESAPNGFFRVMSDSSPAILQQVRKYQYSSTGNHNGSEIGYYDPDYNEKYTVVFEQRITWWKLENGALQKISRRKAGKLLKNTIQDGSFSASFKGWHPVEGTGSELFQAYIPPVSVGSSDDLPANFFEEEFDLPSDLSSLDARYKNKVYVIGSDNSRRSGGNVTVSGTVSDDDGTPLESVIIYDVNAGAYTNTGKNGHYSLTLPAGDDLLVFSDAEKEEQRLIVELVGDGYLNVVLHDKSTMLDEALVSAETMRNHRTAVMGVEKIGAQTLSRIPTVFGEKDVLKVVLTLPGVQTVGEASAGFNVRGGSSDQNLVLFNGNTIYYPTHFFGINSVFNPDLVESVELYKGSVPAEFGGRISSVLEVVGKDGNPNKINGSLGLGLLTSRAHIEGPLGKRTTFTLGGRATYSDWMLKALPSSSEFSGGNANFHDINLAVSHKPDDNNTVKAYAYYSGDTFAFGADTTFKYHNANASVHWKHKTAKSLLTLVAGVDHYDNNIVEIENASEGYSLSTAINQTFFRSDVKTEIRQSHQLAFGIDATAFFLEGGHRRPEGDASIVIPADLPTEIAIQPSVYASDNWTVSEKLALESGIRLSAYTCAGEFMAYPELRFSGRYSLLPTLSFKAGANTMTQYIHLISNTLSISPMDTWKMSDANVPATTGWQTSAGAYWTFMGGKVDLSIEGYYKKLHDYIDYGPMASLVMNETLYRDLVRTKGESYGLEFMLRKSVGRLNGWVSYTWSRSFLKDTQYEGINAINGGKWYRSSTDKPHDFKFVGNYAFTRRYSFSLNVDYSTGRPVTLPVAYYQYAGGTRLAYSGRNAYRVPDYFRMDVAFNIDPGHYLKALAHASLTIGCYNVTGRRNAYSVFFDTRGGIGLSGHLLSIFAVPVPYVNLNILF